MRKIANSHVEDRGQGFIFSFISNHLHITVPCLIPQTLLINSKLKPTQPNWVKSDNYYWSVPPPHRHPPRRHPPHTRTFSALPGDLKN